MPGEPWAQQFLALDAVPEFEAQKKVQQTLQQGLFMQAKEAALEGGVDGED